MSLFHILHIKSNAFKGRKRSYYEYENVFLAKLYLFGGRASCLLTLFVLIMLVGGCAEEIETADEHLQLLKLETLPEVVTPVNNPSSPEKIKLGKLLFFDPILSGEKDVACATCHHPEHGYSDGLDLSIGVGGQGVGAQRTEDLIRNIPRAKRNALTVINSAYNGLLHEHQLYNPLLAPVLWDGRKKSLETQSLGPPVSFNEMRGNAYAEEVTFDSLIARLKNVSEYIQLFDAAFGGGINSVTKENLSKAIAAFERTIVSRNSPYDQYVNGNVSALTPEQKTGLMLFFGKANCATCHSGPMFSDYNYYNLGMAHNMKRDETDKGRNNTYTFRTPTLRNITLSAPYMHNGLHATLEEVMHYYREGVSENASIPNIDVKIKPLDLSSDEVSAIIAFMTSLTDESYDKTIPETVPSGLKPGGK